MMKTKEEVIIIVERIREVEKDGKSYVLWLGNNNKYYITNADYQLAHYGTFTEIALGYSDTELFEIDNLSKDYSNWTVVDKEPDACFRLYNVGYEWYHKHLDILKEAETGEDERWSSLFSAIYHYLYEQVEKEKLDVPESNLQYLVQNIFDQVLMYKRRAEGQE